MNKKESMQKLVRSCYVTSTIVDGKIVFSDWNNSLPEVEVNMDYVLNTTDDEFIAFGQGKILLMAEDVQNARDNRWWDIMRKRYPLTEEQLNEINQSSNT